MGKAQSSFNPNALCDNRPNGMRLYSAALFDRDARVHLRDFVLDVPCPHYKEVFY